MGEMSTETAVETECPAIEVQVTESGGEQEVPGSPAEERSQEIERPEATCEPPAEETQAISADHEHVPVIDPAVDPTCMKPGLTEGCHCSLCNEVLVAQITVPATGHDFVNDVCSVCGTEYEDLKVEISLDKYEMHAGDPLEVTYQITGGKGVYSITGITWSFDNGAKSSGSMNDVVPSDGSFTVDWIDTSCENGCISLRVKDSSGIYATGKSDNLKVKGINVDVFKVDKEVGLASETVTVNYAISGGTEPYTIKPSISGYNGDTYFNLELDTAQDATGTFSFSLPDVNGTLNLQLYIRDRKNVYQYSDNIAIAIGTSIKKTVTGKCGMLDWILTTDGVLTISGEGEIPGSLSVWNDYKNSVEKIVIESGVTSIGYSAFANFKRLNEVTIADTVQTIQYSAFNNCGQLQDITLPSSLTSIDFSAFSNTAIRQLTIPKGVHSISAGTNQLDSITVAEGNTAYCVEDGVLFSKDMQTLVCWPGRKAANEYRIPSSVKTIDSYAFYGANISRVVLPDTVKNIWGEAFANSLIRSIDIPSGVEYISSFCFNNCSKLVSVTIPDTVKSIGDYAFSGCSSLTQLYIPNSVTSIPSSAIPKTTTILCTEGSYASRWADSYDVGKQVHEHEWVLQEEKVVSCMEDGYSKYACATCGTVKTETTQKTGHEFVDGVCAYCGEEYQEMQIILEPDRITINVGETITLNYQITGGSGIYTINKLDLQLSETSCWELLYYVSDIHASQGRVSFTPDTYVPNAYYSIRVTDSLGNVKTAKSERILIDGCHFTRLEIDKKKAMPGENVHINYAIEGGKAPYNLRINTFYYPLDEESFSEEETLNSVSATGTLTFTLPSYLCDVGYNFAIVDANGRNCYGDYQYVSATQKTVINVWSDKKMVRAGEPVTFTWETTGIEGPYSMLEGVVCYSESFSGDNDEDNIYELQKLTGYSASDSVTIVPVTGSKLWLQLNISKLDGTGYSVDSDMVTITDGPVFTKLTRSVMADKSVVQYGEPVTITYNVSGWSNEFSKIRMTCSLLIGDNEAYMQSPIANIDPVEISGQVVFTPVIDAHIRERAVNEKVMMHIIFYVEDRYGHFDSYVLEPIPVEGSITPYEHEVTVLRGDVNGDGTVDGRDAIRLKNGSKAKVLTFIVTMRIWMGILS